MKVSLFREGSDPEYLFAYQTKSARTKDSVWMVMPAEALASPNREIRLASWIGTDGHGATAEIRPAPAHNVRWHLAKIADAMMALRKFLSVREEFSRLSAVAQPVWRSEKLGGHIHLSLWVESPLTAQVFNEYGLVSYYGDFRSVVRERHEKEWDKKVLLNYMNGIMEGTELSIEGCVNKIHSLLGPYEHMLWGAARHGRRGVPEPLVRLADQYEVPAFNPNKAYMRFEYRYPSTWLAHPCLAYTYLALVKLAVLNWDLVGPQPDIFSKETFQYQFERIVRDKACKRTPDLHGLEGQIRAADKYLAEIRGWDDATREAKPLLVDFQAWAEVAFPN